jgi:hypothetical protein
MLCLAAGWSKKMQLDAATGIVFGVAGALYLLALLDVPARLALRSKRQGKSRTPRAGDPAN